MRASTGYSARSSRALSYSICAARTGATRRCKQEITRVAVYRAAPVEPLTFRKRAGSVALIHSPRAGNRFAELVKDRGTISIAAISEAAAAAVGDGWRTVETAKQPSDDALLALAARLCKKPDPK